MRPTAPGEAEGILHVGDFTEASVLDVLGGFAPVHAVHGNMDEWPLRGALPERAVVEAGGLRVGLVHDPGPSNAAARTAPLVVSRVRARRVRAHAPARGDA